eukprot:CCRYP_005950-RA/>CCRYP_005950-RA protein AED:0.01 eAED:0.01 QI:280/1/1/1/1/1/3/454/1446
MDSQEISNPPLPPRHTKQQQQQQQAMPIRRNHTLDPTGMFRNRGRHVVIAPNLGAPHTVNNVPQDRRLNLGDGGHIKAHDNATAIDHGSAGANIDRQYNKLQDESNGTSVSINRSVRPVSTADEQTPLPYVQSTGAKTKEDEDNNHVNATRQLYSVTEGAPVASTAEKDGLCEDAKSFESTDNLTSLNKGESSSQYDHDNIARSSELTAENYAVFSSRHECNDCNNKVSGHDEESDDQDGNDSTVSIMGSTVHDDLEDDDSKMWKSAMYGRTLRREHQNFSENVQRSDDDARGFGVLKVDIPELLVNQKTIEENDCSSEKSAVNASMECHVDTSYLLDESQLVEDENEEAQTIHSNVVRVADFSSTENGASEARYYSDAEDEEFVITTTSPVKGPTNHHQSSVKDTIHGIPKYKTETINAAKGAKIEQESPLRAAFRRTAASAESNIRRIASPRFPPASCTSEDIVERGAFPNTNSLPLPLQLARKCFSFDDTTLDDDVLAVPYQPQFGVEIHSHGLPTKKRHVRQFTSSEYYGLSAVASFSECEENSLRKAFPLKRTSKSFNGLGYTKSAMDSVPQHLASESKDVNGIPFRGIKTSNTWDHNIGSYTRVGDEKVPSISVSSIDSGSRDNLRKDFEKASSLLHSIVDQVLNFNSFDTSESDPIWKGLLCEQCLAQVDNDRIPDRPGIVHCESCTCSYRLKQIVNSIKDASSVHEKHNTENDFPVSHQMRSDAIDALMICYDFVRNLNKAALPAHEWLESVGHAGQKIAIETQPLGDIGGKSRLQSSALTIANKQEEINRLNKEVSRCREEIGRLMNLLLSQAGHQHGVSSVDRSILSNSSEDSIDACLKLNNSLILCSSHPVVKLSQSNEESFARFERRLEADLNLESRKEIICLKAALEKANMKIASLERCKFPRDQKDPFPSDIEPITGNDDGESDHIFMKIAEGIENSMNPSYNGVELKTDGYNGQSGTIRLDDPCLEKELEEYRAALIETISARGGIAESAQDASKSCESEFADQRMINVRMIDGENFVTEWDVVSPLPPPPDHGLRSPIVDTILSRWTNDAATQSALIEWVESILDGSSPDAVPPLKIAGLDHQLKEGFIMHVFPLLLRRKDIHVQVSSRATRTTNYDLAVSVSQSADATSREPGASGNYSSETASFANRDSSINLHHRESKCHLMAFRATCSGSIKENDSSYNISEAIDKSDQHQIFPGLVRNGSNAGSISTAVTSPISNRTPTKSSAHAQTNRYTSKYLATDGIDMNGSFPDEPELPIMAGASPSLVDDLSVGSSVDDEEVGNRDQGLRQNNLMNSIGGAFGLLSRRKPAMPTTRSPYSTREPNVNNESPPRIFLTPQRDITHSIPSHEKNHPYHRVVSAPPGKIGLRFVEHRGNCMVVDVADSSPLAGWVYREFSYVQDHPFENQIGLTLDSFFVLRLQRSLGHRHCH